ncbi:TPA: hypothetical protein WIV99_001774, partial [Neisseria meningitidis]
LCWDFGCREGKEFCKGLSKYVFDETDVNALFGEDVVGVAKGLPRHTVQ